jgi:hypothetical protein
MLQLGGFYRVPEIAVVFKNNQVRDLFTLSSDESVAILLNKGMENYDDTIIQQFYILFFVH